ncbi:MAG: hypothetical protein SGI91_05400 [Alphaproteobacteria bacterium]|jgi:hypothetical protein|nr:hypothetical protein [Alphaproteobacteria bacterium]
MNLNRGSIAALIALAMLAPLAPPAFAQPDEKCRGPKDETELDTTAIRVVASKREDFLAAVRTYAAGKSLGVGSATDKRGWVVLLLETSPYGVTIEVESTDINNFRAVVRTCNATQDWRPYWTAFMQFIDANRAQWSS